MPYRQYGIHSGCPLKGRPSPYTKVMLALLVPTTDHIYTHTTCERDDVYAYPEAASPLSVTHRPPFFTPTAQGLALPESMPRCSRLRPRVLGLLAAVEVAA